jgi:endonuclease/exonuclease/phosphatase family metal-dependent hydrolase
MDAFEEKVSGFGNNYTRTFPPVRIDYIFLPEEFKILNYKVERVRISDHFPIWVEFNIP